MDAVAVCAELQLRLGELAAKTQMHAAEAADVDLVVEVMIKNHIEFEVRKDRYKAGIKK